MRVRSFDGGFDSAFGSHLSKGHLRIAVRDSGDTKDGDVLEAFNRRRIRMCHAHHACKGPNAAGARRSTDSLLYALHRHTYQFHFQRVLIDTVLRTDLWTGAEQLLNNTLTETGLGLERIDVPRYVALRLAHPQHRIFGLEGAEEWFGGRSDFSHARLDLVWGDIESKTELRETDFPNWPFTQRELQSFLVVDTHDFSDALMNELMSPLMDTTDPENPVQLASRKHRVNWRALRDVVESDVLDNVKVVDIRGRKHVRGLIVEEK